MTEQEMREQLQKAQDTVDVLCDQRNTAHNENAQLKAQIVGLQRKLKEMEDKLAAQPAPKSNGSVIPATVIDAEVVPATPVQ